MHVDKVIESVIEKPIYYEKEVIIDNKDELKRLNARIAELEAQLRNAPTKEVEKTLYVEDVQKIKELSSKVNRLIVEIESL